MKVTALYQGELSSEYLIQDIAELTSQYRGKGFVDGEEDALEWLMNRITESGFKKLGIPHREGKKVVYVGMDFAIVEILWD